MKTIQELAQGDKHDTHTEALKLALEALNEWGKGFPDLVGDLDKQAIAAIKEALAQPQQEPVATLWQHGRTGRTRITMPGDITDCDANWFPAADLYAAPPQRKPLSLDELEALWNSQADHMNQWDELGLDEIVVFAQAAHGIKE